MSKPIKNMISGTLRSRYGELDSALVVEFIGIDGNTNNDFRRELRQKQMRMEIVKNSLFRRAVLDGPLKLLTEQMSGPTAVLTGGESLIDVAKVVDEWMPKLKGLTLKAAVLEGEYLDQTQTADLHKMPTKSDLQAQIASAALAPGANLAAAVLAGGGNIAACIKALIGKLEDGEEIRKSA